MSPVIHIIDPVFAYYHSNLLCIYTINTLQENIKIFIYFYYRILDLSKVLFAFVFVDTVELCRFAYLKYF